jgi:hypothetical protein
VCLSGIPFTSSGQPVNIENGQESYSNNQPVHIENSNLFTSTPGCRSHRVEVNGLIDQPVNIEK